MAPQVAELWCRPHIPLGQISGMGGTAEKMGHCVVGGVVIETDGVIDPAYRVAVGLEPRAMTVTELGDGAVVLPW